MWTAIDKLWKMKMKEAGCSYILIALSSTKPMLIWTSHYLDSEHAYCSWTGKAHHFLQSDMLHGWIADVNVGSISHSHASSSQPCFKFMQQQTDAARLHGICPVSHCQRQPSLLSLCQLLEHGSGSGFNFLQVLRLYNSVKSALR